MVEDWWWSNEESGSCVADLQFLDFDNLKVVAEAIMASLAFRALAGAHYSVPEFMRNT